MYATIGKYLKSEILQQITFFGALQTISTIWFLKLRCIVQDSENKKDKAFEKFNLKEDLEMIWQQLTNMAHVIKMQVKFLKDESAKDEVHSQISTDESKKRTRSFDHKNLKFDEIYLKHMQIFQNLKALSIVTM